MWLYIPRCVPSPSAPGSKDLESESISPLSPSALALLSKFCTWNGKASPPRSWSQRWQRGSFLTRLSGLTLEPLAAQSAALTFAQLLRSTSCSGESPASPGQPPESREGSRMSATSGPWPRSLLNSLLLPGSSWRTSQDSLFGTDLAESPGDFEDWATEWRRSCSALGTLAQATGGSGCSFWPTARTITGGGESAERKQELGRKESGGGDLQAAVQSWPTPQLWDAKDFHAAGTMGGPAMTKEQKDARGGGCANLAEHAQAWKTPTAEDSADREFARNNRGEPKLSSQTSRFSLPDPRPSEPGQESSNAIPDLRRRLNPRFVEWLMNLPPGFTGSEPLGMAWSLYRQATLSALFTLLCKENPNP